MSGTGNTYWTYSPNDAVKAGHKIPHVYSNGQYAPEKYQNFPNNTAVIFNAGAGAITATTGWLPSLFTVPFILLALGLISIVFMDLAFLFRCCCRCLKCGVTEDMVNNDPLKVVKKRKFIWYWFLFWVAIVVLADHALFFGNADLDKAIDSGAKSLGTLAGMFSDIASYAGAMGTAFGEFNTIAQASSTCTNSGQGIDLTTFGTAGATAANTISTTVGTIPDSIRNYQGYLGSDAKDYKTKIIWVLYAVICVLALAFPLNAYFLRSKCLMYLLMMVAEIIVLIYTFLCAILMFFVMFLSDFCMNPTSAITSPEIIVYYTKCIGDSPFAKSITDVQTQLTSITDSFQYCSWAPTSTQVDAKGKFDLATSQLGKIGATASCGPGNNLNMVWNQAVNEGICGNFMNGFFKIWVSQYVVSGALFFTIICASVLYQYFSPEIWNLKATGETGVDKDLENPTAQAPEYELTHAEYDGGEAAFTDSETPNAPPPPPKAK